MTFIRQSTLQTVFCENTVISVTRTGWRHPQKVPEDCDTHTSCSGILVLLFLKLKGGIRSSCSPPNGSCMLMSSSESANAAKFVAGRHGFLSPVLVFSSNQSGKNHQGWRTAESKIDLAFLKLFLHALAEAHATKKRAGLSNCKTSSLYATPNDLN